LRYVTYASDNGPRAGILVEDAVVDADTALRGALLGDRINGAPTTRRLLGLERAQRAALGAAAEAAADRGDALEAGDVTLHPPVPDPEKIICLGLNYRAHAHELEQESPPAPILFPKFPPSLIGPGAPIQPPPGARAVDYEGELAIVIGRRCKGATAADALDHVAGCMPFNDVSERDLQFQTGQWTAGKALDTFAPCGPALVSLDEVGDLSDLTLRTWVNGTLMQEAPTAAKIFPVPEIVAFISRLVTLVPGDIIATGTPEGVGFRRDPPVFLSDGDTVEVEIEDVGRLVNPVVAGWARA
jgi:2-keto-4-pentenoate hydratase/2-oxohepta-3-ene-1,7-dioic acid hydratase in catechol pathway